MLTLRTRVHWVLSKVSMVSYHPASKGKSSIYGVILVLLVFLTVIFSGCSALPTSGSDHIIVPDSKTSLAVARESLDVPKTTALDRRFDSNLVPTGSQPLSLLILRSWAMFISAMFFRCGQTERALEQVQKGSRRSTRQQTAKR